MADHKKQTGSQGGFGQGQQGSNKQAGKETTQGQHQQGGNKGFGKQTSGKTLEETENDE